MGNTEFIEIASPELIHKLNAMQEQLKIIVAAEKALNDMGYSCTVMIDENADKMTWQDA